MEQPILLHPIGVIRSPYKESHGTPIQGVFDKNATPAWVELNGKYAEGMKDLDGSSHAILLYHFQAMQPYKIQRLTTSPIASTVYRHRIRGRDSSDD
jgi:tRNA (adenine37-N6)-methyltransferase